MMFLLLEHLLCPQCIGPPSVLLLERRENTHIFGDFVGNKAQGIKKTPSIFCERDGRNFPGVTRRVGSTRGIQLSVSISADATDCNGRKRVDFFFFFLTAAM